MYLIWSDKIPSMVSIVDRLDFFPQKEKHSIETQYVSVLPTNDWYVCKEKMFTGPCPLINCKFLLSKSSPSLVSNFRWIGKLEEFPWEILTYSEYQEDNGGTTSHISIMLAKSLTETIFFKENNVKKIYFSSQFHRFQPIDGWIHCYGLTARLNIMIAGSHKKGGLLTSLQYGKQGKREKGNRIHTFKGMPSLALYFQNPTFS